LAVKIVRQPKSIVLLGAPTSAASLRAGHEQAPAALRAAGLVTRLNEAGFEVSDQGDLTTRVFEPDEEHPRARNLAQVLATLEELRPRVEVAVKAGALPLIVGGDDSIVLAAIAGTRRYYRNLSLLYVDRDAGLNVPASTPSGCVDGMVMSHVIGRGAPELVRFWGEPPLIREPEVALFGIHRLDEPEQEFLVHSPLHRYGAEEVARMGASAAAERALESVHGRQHEFVLHVDLDVIAGEDFAATNLSAPGGLRFEELRQALAVFARQPKLGALVISAYNPALDPDGAAAKQLIALLVEILAPRLEAPAEGETEKAEGASAAAGESGAAAASAEPAPAAEDGGQAPKDEDAAAAPATSEATASAGAESAEPAEPAVPSSEPEPHPETPEPSDGTAEPEDAGG
jgi:arginase